MRPKRFPLNLRRLGVRTFRSRELEHEFRRTFRSAGVRFFEIGTAVSGLAYLAFFLIYLVSSQTGPLAQPQPLRLAMAATLLSAAGIGRYAKPLLYRHYELICVSAVVVGVLCTSLIGGLVQSGESPYSRYWAIYSSAVFVTCIVFGFTRLSTPSTLALAALNTGLALWLASQGGADAKVIQRLTSISAASISSALRSTGSSAIRERKLFLRGKRQRSLYRAQARARQG